MDDPLRLSRRARGVEDEQHILGVHRLGRAVGGRVLHEAVIPVVAPFLHLDMRFANRSRGAPLHDDHVLHRRAFGIHVTAFGNNHVDTLRSETYLAVARIGVGEAGAAADFARARDSLSTAIGSNHPSQKQLTHATTWVALTAEQRSTGNTSNTGNAFRLIDF